MKENLKSLLLVVLIFTNLILGSSVLSMQKLWSGDDYNFFVDTKIPSIKGYFSSFFHSDSNESKETHLEFPERIIINTGYQTSRQSLTISDKAFYDIFTVANEFLTSAFTQEQQFSSVSNEEFYSVLNSRSVYLRYPTDYDATLFSYLLGAGVPSSSLGFSKLRNAVISIDGTVYLEDTSNGSVYKLATDVPTQSLADFIEACIEENNSTVINYAFDLGFDVAFSTQKTVLSPTIPVYSGSFEAETVLENDILLTDEVAREDIMSNILPLFHMNPNSLRRYTEVDGTVVYVENNAVLKLTTDGYIHYQPKDDGISVSSITSPNVNDSVISTAAFVDRLNSTAGLHSTMQISSKLTSEELSSERLTLTFDYLANGSPVRSVGSPAVSVTIKDGRIIEYRHKLCSFERTGNFVALDSYIDALDSAISEFQNQINGIEIDKIDICYTMSDTGRELIPHWSVDVKEITING